MSEEQVVLEMLNELLHSIRTSDAQKYKELVAEDLTCFEPETQGHPVDGLPFHLFFINNAGPTKPYHLELVRPTIRIYGDTAYAAYTLLITTITDEGPVIKQVNETRIFRKNENRTWQMVHFHRS